MEKEKKKRWRRAKEGEGGKNQKRREKEGRRGPKTKNIKGKERKRGEKGVPSLRKGGFLNLYFYLILCYSGVFSSWSLLTIERSTETERTEKIRRRRKEEKTKKIIIIRKQRHSGGHAPGGAAVRGGEDVGVVGHRKLPGPQDLRSACHRSEH